MKKHKKFVLIYSLALIIRLIFAIPFIHDWDGYVFSESAKNFLDGESPYMTVLKNDPSIYPDSNKPLEQQWYAYPPLPLLMFTAPLALPHAFNIQLDPRRNISFKVTFHLGGPIGRLVSLQIFRDKRSKNGAQG